MADDKNPTEDQEKLAKEVLAGERTITASEPKVDKETMRQAALEGQRVKEAAKVDAIPMKDVPTAELGTGEAGHPTFVHGAYSDAATPAPTPSPTPEPGK